MKISKLFYFAGLFAVLALPGYSQAALVSEVFNSAAWGPIVVTRVTGPTFLAARAGYAVEISVSWDDEQAESDSDPYPISGGAFYRYTASPSGIKVLINGTEYTHSYARGDYGMRVYNNSLSSIWGKIDHVSFTGRIDSKEPNFILVGFSGAGEEVLSDDSLPSLAELAAFPYIAGRFDILGPGATRPSTVWFASANFPRIIPDVPIPATIWLFVSGIGILVLRQCKVDG